MAEIVAKRIVEHLEQSGFGVMKRPAIGGGAALGRGFEDLNRRPCNFLSHFRVRHLRQLGACPSNAKVELRAQNIVLRSNNVYCV
jgi:hypothetical protein